MSLLVQFSCCCSFLKQLQSHISIIININLTSHFLFNTNMLAWMSKYINKHVIHFIALSSHTTNVNQIFIQKTLKAAAACTAIQGKCKMLVQIILLACVSQRYTHFYKRVDKLLVSGCTRLAKICWVSCLAGFRANQCIYFTLQFCKLQIQVL